MPGKKSYAVFGLGRYGLALAKELVDNGMEVLAVDRDERIVNDVVGMLPVCKCADVTDAEAFGQLGISNMDVVIIAMASSFEASVMAVTLCKEAGVKTVIAKCGSEIQQRILLRVGADRVVFPEKEAGVHLAKSLLSSGFIDMFALSQEMSIIEMDMRPEWVGKNLAQLNLRRKYGINVVALRKGEKVDVTVNPESPLEAGSTLIVIANNEQLSRLKA